MSTPPDERSAFLEILRAGACAAAAILAGAALLCPAARASLGGIAEGDVKPDGLYLNWLDRSVAPGKDFFQFANGGWIKSHPIPPDRAYWGVDTLLEQQNQIFIRNLIESLAQEHWAAGTPQRKIADFYASGMDERAIDAAGAAPLAPELARIAAITSREELPQALAHLQSIGVEAPLSIGQMQDFADSTRVIAVMTPEIDELIQALHSGSDEPMAAIWARYNASVAPPA